MAPVETEDFGVPSGPLSWRDVYRAVEESEKRILKAIADTTVPLRADSEDHERRLRLVENAPERVTRLEGIVTQYHETTDKRLAEIERAAVIESAKRIERGHILVSTRTIVISIISIITSIIVATAGALAMLDRLAK